MSYNGCTTVACRRFKVYARSVLDSCKKYAHKLVSPQLQRLQALVHTNHEKRSVWPALLVADRIEIRLGVPP